MNGSLLEVIIKDMKEEQKFCVKCTHLLGNRSYTENWKTWRCNKTKIEEGINLVTGEIIYTTFYCDEVRKNPVYCGPEGKWYEEYKRPQILENPPFRNPEDPIVKKSRKVTEDDLANL